MNSSLNSSLNAPEFKLQSHEIARGFALVPPQSARTMMWHERHFDYAMARLDSGRGNEYGIWLCERGLEARGHWLVASSEPSFEPFVIEITSTKRRPVPDPRIVSALCNRDGLTLARFVASPLPRSAPYALLIPNGTGCWYSYGRVASFDFAPTPAIEESSASAAAWLHGELAGVNSSVAFANEWISLNSEGKVSRLYGADWLAETQTVMRHVLRVLPAWSEKNRWEGWTIHPRAPHICGWMMRDEKSAQFLDKWSQWLIERCRSRQSQSWPGHRCIDEFKEDDAIQAFVSSAPSSHQRLESLLWLRDWLRDAATPDECAQLLAI